MRALRREGTAVRPEHVNVRAMVARTGVGLAQSSGGGSADDRTTNGRGVGGGVHAAVTELLHGVEQIGGP